MQRGSVDVLKQLRQARSRIEKTIKFLEAKERSERKAALKRQQDEHDQRMASIECPVTTP